MRVLVCGGRQFDDMAQLYEELDKLNLKPIDDLIIEGGAKGADTLAENYAADRDIPCLRVPADWSQGKSAGPIRNVKMLRYKPDLIVAFAGGRGTEHMISIAKEHGIAVKVIPPCSEEFYKSLQKTLEQLV